MNDPDLIDIIAAIWATMNTYMVINRQAGAPVRQIAWPGSFHGEEYYVFHRGGRLPGLVQNWWNVACRNHDVFRAPMAVPVSKQIRKSLFFMHNMSTPDGEPKAYFRFYLQEKEVGEDYPCKHAVCLDAVSALPNEQEFLFPPFSCFQAMKKVWDERLQHYIIEVRVFQDNKLVSEDVKLCPWI
jgi:hypothetical protein